MGVGHGNGVVGRGFRHHTQSDFYKICEVPEAECRAAFGSGGGVQLLDARAGEGAVRALGTSTSKVVVHSMPFCVASGGDAGKVSRCLRKAMKIAGG